MFPGDHAFDLCAITYDAVFKERGQIGPCCGCVWESDIVHALQVVICLRSRGADSIRNLTSRTGSPWAN
jgi:hypothetical protein